MPKFWHFKCWNWRLTFMKWTPNAEIGEMTFVSSHFLTNENKWQISNFINCRYLTVANENNLPIISINYVAISYYVDFKFMMQCIQWLFVCFYSMAIFFILFMPTVCHQFQWRKQCMYVCMHIVSFCIRYHWTM